MICAQLGYKLDDKECGMKMKSLTDWKEGRG
jgi:hypothetical protein